MTSLDPAENLTNLIKSFAVNPRRPQDLTGSLARATREEAA